MKRSEVLIHDTVWMNSEKQYVKWKKPDTKGHMLYDSIHWNIQDT